MAHLGYLHQIGARYDDPIDGWNLDQIDRPVLIFTNHPGSTRFIRTLADATRTFFGLLIPVIVPQTLAARTLFELPFRVSPDPGVAARDVLREQPGIDGATLLMHATHPFWCGYTGYFYSQPITGVMIWGNLRTEARCLSFTA